MTIKDFVIRLNADFYTGVPDSQLKALCNYLMQEYGISNKHMIGANEGNCTALAAGYYLATGKIPVVYMQNSGIGNMINPAASLLNDRVYGIPCIFIVGWRGEPNVHDEPQHIYQGEVTIQLLEDMDIRTFVISQETNENELTEAMRNFDPLLKSGKSVAFVIQKNALSFDKEIDYHNSHLLIREEIIRHITAVSDQDIVVSTTGKASRELFEIREANHQSHESDFLTVGSMGHSSSIALSIALNKPDSKVWCIDGDGAVLMHMGSLAVIGANKPHNMVHIVINNGAHETVGGMPTVAESINFVQIAKGCGYPSAVCAESFEALDAALIQAKNTNQLSFIEVKSAIGSRENLGRPTTTADENCKNFMKYLKSKK